MFVSKSGEWMERVSVLTHGVWEFFTKGVIGGSVIEILDFLNEPLSHYISTY